MKPKHIIVALLALAGVAGGAWNWISYFKQHASPAAPALEAVRKPSKVEEAFQAQAAAAAPTAPSVAPTPGETAPREVNVPSTIQRNPFLSPEEEQALARGVEIVIETPQEAPPPASVQDIQVRGVIQDNVSGKFMALVDGRYYGVGDRIGDENVVRLDDRTLVLERDGRLRQIPVQGGSGLDTATSVIRMRKVN